ncbi:MAG: hypothetical protein ACOCP9_07105, partial [Halofilum sp. (in: g-proteobacteria)]
NDGVASTQRRVTALLGAERIGGEGENEPRMLAAAVIAGRLGLSDHLVGHWWNRGPIRERAAALADLHPAAKAAEATLAAQTAEQAMIAAVVAGAGASAAAAGSCGASGSGC